MYANSTYIKKVRSIPLFFALFVVVQILDKYHSPITLRSIIFPREINK